MAEAFIRIVEPEHPLTAEEEVLMEREWKYYEDNDVDYSECDVAAYHDCINILKNVAEQTEKDQYGRHDISSLEEDMVEDNGNPVSAALSNIVDLLRKSEDEQTNSTVIAEMNRLSQHDIIQMSFALREAVTEHPAGNFRRILEQPGYDNIFSGKTENFHEDCLTLFYMVQVIRYSRSTSIALAIEYYHLLSGQHENLLFAFGHPLFYPVFVDALVKRVPLEMSAMRVNRDR